MKKYSLINLKNIEIPLAKPYLIFLKWDLWAWKTTISKHILNNLLKVKEDITSPTYTYYNKYNWFLDKEEVEIYHFDLYRLSNYDEFFAIWAEDIFDNNNWIILVEWPDIIEKYYKPDLIIELFKTEKQDERQIKITSN